MVAPIKAQLSEHIAWVSLIPNANNVITNPSFIGYAPDLKRPKYKLYRFEMSRKKYEAFKHGSDIDAREESNISEEKFAETEAEVEQILLDWQVDFTELILAVGSGYPPP